MWYSLKYSAILFSTPHRQIHQLTYFHPIPLPRGNSSLNLFFYTLLLFPCFILHPLLWQSSGDFDLGELFSATTLIFDLEFSVFQECICLVHIKNESKLPNLPLLGDKKFFKRETYFPKLNYFSTKSEIFLSTLFSNINPIFYHEGGVQYSFHVWCFRWKFLRKLFAVYLLNFSIPSYHNAQGRHSNFFTHWIGASLEGDYIHGKFLIKRRSSLFAQLREMFFFTLTLKHISQGSTVQILTPRKN